MSELKTPLRIKQIVDNKDTTGFRNHVVDDYGEIVPLSALVLAANMLPKCVEMLRKIHDEKTDYEIEGQAGTTKSMLAALLSECEPTRAGEGRRRR